MSTDSRGDYSHPPGSDPLAHLYAEWRSLTEAEGRAIEIAAWDHLLSLQQAKAQLQTAIVEVESASVSRGKTARGTARLIEELIHMESRNAERLAVRRDEAQNDRAAMDKSRFDLRRLQQRLVVTPMTGWQCYS